ncbi:MAG: PIN domain-containing protein, partial [Planctomycetia bacterium]|nr:PIN domain-containing protein [Planctomycetia bacterium]
ASFEVMRQHGVRDALTSDRHFKQAGFNCLLSSGT